VKPSLFPVLFYFLSFHAGAGSGPFLSFAVVIVPFFARFYPKATPLSVHPPRAPREDDFPQGMTPRAFFPFGPGCDRV